MADVLEAIFGPDGLIARSHPQYEVRPGQAAMAGLVASTFERGGVAVVEAGTGTGKTLAYLIPAIASGRRVIVSTATKSLQEQLYQKDVPFLQKALPRPFRAAYMKGRSNYVCLRRVRRATESPILDDLAAVDQFEAVREWSERSETGDRAELTDLPEHLPFWHAIDARSDTCLGQRCPDFDACFITRMRQRAEEADVVIVNHHLFFADLALRGDDYGHVIPDYTTVVFDEAHELEAIAAGYFGSAVSNYRVEDLAMDVGRLLVTDADTTRDLSTTAARLVQRADRFWLALSGSAAQRAEYDEGEQRRQITSDLFVAPGPGGRGVPSRLGELLLDLRDTISHLAASLDAVKDPPPEAEALARRAAQIQFDLEFIAAADDPNYVYWYERRGRGTFLNATPIDVSSILAERLFDRVEAAVLTSATLTTGGGFDYITSRLGIPEAEELVVESHFDYGRQMLLYLPQRMPDPREPAFVERAAEEVAGLIEASRGRAFVLFTSLQQMRQVHELVREQVDYPTMVQGEGSKAGLLERFRATEGAVLFATSSFWQGIDVQGEALSCVIIAKLPFAVPSDPVVAARCRAVEERGGNAFHDYSVPEAVITLKQGVGRLIRSCGDRGVVSILDPRLRTKSYGRTFLQGLPPCPVTTRLDDVRRVFGDT
jgi:ATP-dependent DNA helicase DinG